MQGQGNFCQVGNRDKTIFEIEVFKKNNKRWNSTLKFNF